MSAVAFPAGQLRVKALSQRRFRAGLEFGREPRDLQPEHLGSNLLAGLAALIAIAEDPLLSAVFIDADGNEMPIGTEELAEMRTALAELELEAQGTLDTGVALVEHMGKPGGCFRLRIRSGGDVQLLTEDDLGGYPGYLQPLLDIAMDPAIDAVFVNDAGDEVELDAAKIEAIRATLNQLQTPGGADAETDGAAALSGDAEASGGGAKSEPASSITTPAGADSGPAPLTEQARQQADDDAADRKASSDEGQKPGDAAEPPVAGPKKRNRS